MLAARLPGLLPPLTPAEALEVSVVRSVAGLAGDERMRLTPPFRDPHHSASLAALTGGGTRAKPGEISLAYGGVLFLDELPEFSRAALESLRQPLEAGRITVARVNAHVTYPARFQLIAAMNLCRCGYLGEAAPSIRRGCRDRCWTGSTCISTSAPCARPIWRNPQRRKTAPTWRHGSPARARRRARFQRQAGRDDCSLNARAEGALLQAIATPDAAGAALLLRATERLRLSARGYRLLRVARTIADLEEQETVSAAHIAEALSWRLATP